MLHYLAIPESFACFPLSNPLHESFAMRTNHSSTRSLALAEFRRITAIPAGASIEAAFEMAVDTVLANGNHAAAEMLYSRFAAVCESRTIREESSQREAVAYAEAVADNYSSGEPRPAVLGRELLQSAPAWENLLRRAKPYHAPHGPALRNTYASEVVAPTARQQAARAEFAIRAAEFGAKHRKYASDAARTAVAHTKERDAARTAGLSIRAYRATRKQPA